MKNVLISVLFVILSVLTQFVIAADTQNGERLSQTCLGCHGAPGLRNAQPVYNVPMIGGQHAEYIVSALQAYKDKQRSHPTMQAQATSLSDADMADIGAYFAAMTGNSRPSKADGAEEGQAKSAVCAGCHGANGDGENSIYPKLAGQYSSYIERALLDYRSGERQNGVMAGFVNGLTIEDIRHLSAWFGSQDGALSAPKIKIRK